LISVFLYWDEREFGVKSLILKVFFLPFISARQAFRSVDTDQFSALGTGPSLFFMFNKRAYSDIADHFKIIDHTHAVPGFVAFIQLFQPWTGETGTAVRATGAFTLFDIVAVSDFTCRAVF